MLYSGNARKLVLLTFIFQTSFSKKFSIVNSLKYRAEFPHNELASKNLDSQEVEKIPNPTYRKDSEAASLGQIRWPTPSASDVKNHEDDIKDYAGWKIITVFLPSAIFLDNLLPVLEASDRIVLLEVFRLQRTVDLALPPKLSLREIIPTSKFPSLCCLDGTDGLESSGPAMTENIISMCLRRKIARQSSSSSSKPEREQLRTTIAWKTTESLSSSPTIRLFGNETLDWNDFYRYDSIMNFSKELASNYSTVEYLEIGRSFEGRPLFALIFATKPKVLVRKYRKKVVKLQRLGKNGILDRTLTKLKERKVRSKNKKKKQYVFIEAGAHAREWISPALATYMAQQLADAGKTFLKQLNVIIVPMANPDGYEFSHTTNRMWRKNRRNITSSSCKGVDLNRNWGKAWGGWGSSNSPCSEIYRGNSSFSEPETKALRDLALVWITKFTFYLTLHSYGNLILYPWSFTTRVNPSDKLLKRIARKMKSYLKKNGFPKFKRGQTSQMLYQASGTSEDYIADAGVDYAYTIELPGNSFTMKPEEIEPISSAFWNTFVCTMGDIAKRKKVKEFCAKRIVKITVRNGLTYSEWIDKNIPLSQAEQTVKENYNKKYGIETTSKDTLDGIQ